MFFGVGITSHHNIGTPPSIPVVTRPITVTGVFGSGDLSPLSASVVVQFGVSGPTVDADIDLDQGTFTCVGEPSASVRGTQTFVITAFASATFPHQPGTPPGTFPTGSGKASVTVRMADLLPANLTIDFFPSDAFPSDVSNATLPLPFMLAGSAIDPDSSVASVQCRLDNGPFELATNLTGNWSRWQKQYTLHAGLHCFTVVATDVGGNQTQQVRFLSIRPPAGAPAPDTPSITSWTRLEPQASGADIGVATSARLFDPLWLMTRQWQVGEFQAEDAGSPVQARVRATSATLTRCHIGELPTNTVTQAPRYDPLTMPLEAMVERRRTRASDASDPRMLSLSVEGGLHYLRMLESQTLSKYRAGFVAKFALQPLSDALSAVVDDATRRFVQTMVGRAVDARLLAAAIRGTGAAQLVLDPTLAIANADRPKVQQTAVAWLTWYDGLLSEPSSPADDAWIPSRLEYAVSVSTRLSPDQFDEVTMSASEFDDGRFDWSNFDLNLAVNMGTAGDTSFSTIAETTVPAPIHFRGAPAQRFWEIEDARVAYGLVPTGPTDLAHLLMIEYATTYGNDWYVVPLTIPVGSVTRVDSLVVTDTFGVRTLLRPIGDPQLPQPFWSMWQPSYVRQRGEAIMGSGYTSNRFFLPPSVAQVLDGGPLEDVLFMRDEMANVAWAIERSLENPIEQAVLRPSTSASTNDGGANAGDAGALPRYLLSSTVPDNWIPLVPVQTRDDQGKIISRLRRGTVLQPDGSAKTNPARGDVLNSAAELVLHDEDVPREGVRVTRSRRMSRWIDGSTWVWTAFRKEVGRGEGSSGLRFDQLNDA